MVYDTIIVGASAAGMSAAVYVARRNLNFTVLTKDIGGEMLISGEIGNWPGEKSTNGVELTEKFKEQMKHYKVDIQESMDVTSVKKEGKMFHITAKKWGEDAAQTFEAKSVIVATGIHPRELGVPGEAELKGKGVTYCTVCDGPLFKGKTTATIGGGNSALESALMMSEIADKVYLINLHDKFYKGDDILIKKAESVDNIEIIYKAETSKIVGEGMVSGLEYKDLDSGETGRIEVQGVMVHIGNIPNSDLVEADKNEFGEIKTDTHCKTSIDGLFAAGDVTTMPYKQLAMAAGTGVCAALAMVDYVNKFED